ncbi:sporulation YhaL family protein [Alkalihalobacillus sp. MEB130]|uniref:sporulation YhaL family protein n=1 Tax=Alkalihalobacillus sp. MEB130 TaxID=2976704 RepID=UPI0028E0706E|nr:sporulation YhaL family protein [Alkalihalobacillus sp. MEB130]MDT8862029.1 sporulation YhaL family protein [Alkalihalobacillus sp. MEB130]
MKKKPSKRFAFILLAILAVGFLLTQTALGTFLLSSPWWVYFVVAGIVLSGYLAVKYSLEDKRTEQEWIENEGNIYMQRLEEERERRKISKG